MGFSEHTTDDTVGTARGDAHDHDSEYVSVIIVSYNSEQHIERCLTAVQSQTRIPNRVFVIDNGSTDNTISLVKEKFKNVVLICTGSNLGFAAANNIGIERTPNHGFVALANPDAFLEQSWIDHMINAAKKYPDVSGFGSKLLLAKSEDALDGVGDTYHVSGLVWRRGHGGPINEAPSEEEEIFSPCAAAALYRTADIRSVGGFDESYFCYLEDTDLGFRMRLAGFKFIYVPGAQASHVVSASSGKHSDFAIYHGHRNLVWTYFKNMPTGLLIRYLPQHLLLNIVSLIVFTAMGKNIIWRAKMDAVKGLSRIWKQRKQVQKIKTTSNAELLRVMERRFTKPYLSRL